MPKSAYDDAPLMRLTIESLTYGNDAIARTEQGKAVFVSGAAPGDTVDVKITKDGKSFARGIVETIVEAGASRVESFCPYSSVCGGCPWAHISYDVQLEAKRDNVVSALTRIGHMDPSRAAELVDPCVPSKRQTGYRNKLELAARTTKNGRFQLGFHESGSAEITTPKQCPIGAKGIQKAPSALRGALGYLQGKDDLGIFRVGVRHSMRTKETEVAIWTTPGAFPRAAAAKTIGSALKCSSIVRVMADPGKSRKIKGVEALSGRGCWHETMHDITYTASAPSFFQVNTAQAEKLIDLVMDGLEVGYDDTVADLYCGAGTFTIPLALRADDVYGVESAASSVRDLRSNVEANEVFVDVIGGDSARELPTLGHLDALVVDPPRAGLADGVPESIAQAAPEKIAYVSCDPSTWARDVVRLEENGYVLSKVTPVDLFPQTYHCELVSIFSRA